jgi:predicted Fe-Mo cluster-binding NifX family protein
MKIAVVSTDGVNVNDHFGKAERFLIYEIKDGKLTLIEERQSVPLSVNDPNHPFDPERFGNIVKMIKDCEKVFVTQIGEVPAEKLKAEGIEPVIFGGAIKDIV